MKFEPISELARTFRQMPIADGNAEIVRWLRAVGEIASGVPVPKLTDPRRTYTRTLLHKNDLFEILVLHWMPGSETPIHDHGGAHCWFAVTAGTMGIENFVRRDAGRTAGHARIALEGRELLPVGGIDYRQDDVHLHRCIAYDEPVMTLHVYAKPIVRFHAFDERAQSCSEVCATYDAVVPW